MSTLLLRLAGPMQAWGVQSRFSMRDTGMEPSKSGVIGLLCAALGRGRDADVSDLAALAMGVRVDHEGVMQRDYHTAGGRHSYRDRLYTTEEDARMSRGAIVTQRYYLADADFLVGLEGERALLETLDGALACPHWQLFLGRKAFAPSTPIRLPDQEPWGPGLREQPLCQALKTYPWPDPHGKREVPNSLRLVLESEPSQSADLRQDTPVSFDIFHRQYAPRYVRTDWLTRQEASS